jgi:hypothetical protein
MKKQDNEGCNLYRASVGYYEELDVFAGIGTQGMSTESWCVIVFESDQLEDLERNGRTLNMCFGKEVLRVGDDGCDPVSQKVAGFSIGCAGSRILLQESPSKLQWCLRYGVFATVSRLKLDTV